MQAVLNGERTSPDFLFTPIMRSYESAACRSWHFTRPRLHPNITGKLRGCAAERQAHPQRPRMIRRNPTMIALSDVDVQDIREVVARTKSAMEVDSAQRQFTVDEAKRKNESTSKEERLGLRQGHSNVGFYPPRIDGPL